MIRFRSQKKPISDSYLINSLVNCGSSYFKAKTNFLIPSNFGYHKPKKRVGKNFNAYKPMLQENSLI